MVGWPMGSLPVDPPSWRWELNGDEGAVSRYRCPAKLMRADEAREPVNVCDPDREGGAILARIRMAMGVDEPVSRPWVVSLDERTIRGARAEADRPVGLNTSRAHTLAWHRRFSVGRVRPPTPDMVVQRDPAIESHTPAPFRRADGSPWARGRCKAIGSGTGPMRGRCPRTRRIPPSSSIISNAVGSVRNRPPRSARPAWKAMNSRHGPTAEQTPAALRRPYGMKAAAYPRTDSGYVTHDDVDTLRTPLRSRYAVGMLIPGTRDAVRPLHGEAGFDPMGRVADGGVAGHTAIPPTRRFTRADPSRAFASHAHALGHVEGGWRSLCHIGRHMHPVRLGKMDPCACLSFICPMRQPADPVNRMVQVPDPHRPAPMAMPVAPIAFPDRKGLSHAVTGPFGRRHRNSAKTVTHAGSGRAWGR